MKQVLVVNFKSPPFQGIGGRRWSKISKGLIRKGSVVHNIRAEWTAGVLSGTFCNGDSRSIEINHPFYQKPGIVKKLKDHWHLIRTKWTGDYSYFDEGAFCIEELKQALREVLSNNKIQWVFISCPPYSWTFETVKLVKSEFKDIQIWVDLRDPWLKANNWGIPGLSPKQRKMEEKRHRFVGENADFISSPAFEILEEFDKVQLSEKLIHLRHFFDWDDHHSAEPVILFDSKTWMYTGQFYVGMDEYVDQLRNFANTHPDLCIKMFSKDVQRFESFFSSTQNVHCEMEQGAGIFEKMSHVHGLILMLSEYNKDFFTTKFFDYLPLQKPIAYFGPNGKVNQYLKAHGEQLTAYLPFEVYSLKGYDISQDELSFRVEQILNLCQPTENSI